MSFGGENSMSLIKCNKCGEVYSDSYKTCPFCVEDEEYYNGKVKKRGHRQLEKKKKAPSAVGPILVLVLVLLAGVLVWAFAGSTVRGWFGGEQPDDVDPGPVQNEPVNTPADNDPVVKALELDHMSLLMAPGESEKLTATGGTEETYQWITSDSGVLKVSDDGTVSALTEGSAVVTVTCGEESVACAITVQKKADTTTTPTDKPDTTTTTKPNDNGNTNVSSSLKNLKIKTMYGTELGKNPDDQFDMTINKNDPPCELTLEGVTGTAKWKSSDTNVVKVSESGTVERVGPGTATITITIGSSTAEILVRVN